LRHSVEMSQLIYAITVDVASLWTKPLGLNHKFSCMYRTYTRVYDVFSWRALLQGASVVRWHYASHVFTAAHHQQIRRPTATHVCTVIAPSGLICTLALILSSSSVYLYL